MHRFRRNQGFELRSPTPRADDHEPPLAGLTALGIVCNPKTHEPLLVVTDGDYVSLRSLKVGQLGRRVGRGYYEGSSNEPAKISGLPRCHTPDGVIAKGGGYGTALYTALALGAHAVDGGAVAIVQRGLAEQQVEEETEREENVDIDVDPGDLDEFVDDDKTVVYVNQVNVDIEETISKKVETLLFETVSSANLIASVFAVEIPGKLEHDAALRFLLEALTTDISDVDPTALLALDVRGLTLESVNLLSICYEEAGLGEAARADLFQRFELGLDPQMSSGQLRLFTPNQHGIGDVRKARELTHWEAFEDLP